MADALRGNLIINEIHAQPVAGAAGFDTDGSGTVSAIDEYVEFRNTGTTPLDISGLQLWDSGSGNWFTFPAGSVLGPGGFAIVVTGVQSGGALPTVAPGSLAFNAARTTAVMNNAGDNLYVVDPDNDTYIAAAYGNWPLMDPTDTTTWGVAQGSTAGLASFPAGVTQIGAGENFGPITPGDAIQRRPGDPDTFTGTNGETPGSQNICFTPGTLIATLSGLRRIESLRIGDRLLTVEGAAVPLRWAGARMLSGGLLDDPRHWPVTIARGALGRGLPHRSLVLSPQHRIMIAGPIATRLFGTTQVLVPVKALVGAPGITQGLPETGRVTYMHLMCDRHVVLRAEGVAAESLYLGPMARAALPRDALDEILTLFPDLDGQLPQPARPLVPAGRGRALLAGFLTRRHSVSDYEQA
jgi:hypothetical protein